MFTNIVVFQTIFLFRSVIKHCIDKVAHDLFCDRSSRARDILAFLVYYIRRFYVIGSVTSSAVNSEYVGWDKNFFLFLHFVKYSIMSSVRSFI